VCEVDEKNATQGKPRGTPTPPPTSTATNMAVNVDGDVAVRLPDQPLLNPHVSLTLPSSHHHRKSARFLVVHAGVQTALPLQPRSSFISSWRATGAINELLNSLAPQVSSSPSSLASGRLSLGAYFTSPARFAQPGCSGAEIWHGLGKQRCR
jgi:hypothetical protein